MPTTNPKRNTFDQKKRVYDQGEQAHDPMHASNSDRNQRSGISTTSPSGQRVASLSPPGSVCGVSRVTYTPLYEKLPSQNSTSNQLSTGNQTTVVNVRKAELNKLGYADLVDWLRNPNHVYIGRDMTRYVPGAVGSKWGNPFKGKLTICGVHIFFYIFFWTLKFHTDH